MADANCNRNCWIAGAGLGLLIWIFSAGIGSAGWLGGLFLGIIAGVLLALLLIWALCHGHAAMDGSHWHPGSRPTRAADPVETPRPRGSESEAAMAFAGAATASPVPAAQPDHPAPQAYPAPQADVAPSGEAQAGHGGPRPEPEKNDIHSSASDPAPATDAGAAATGPTDADPAAADDLKQIKGVGPKLEETLHEHGVTRFAQIAAWDEAEIDRFAEILGRMGTRIRSEDWVDQARVLASGGETEFSARVEKGDVY
ncbi:MAG: endonuclease [Paracoccus sp.]|nr:endonuclease [Paracoccus sp. (in: a-proteobacteria)]